MVRTRGTAQRSVVEDQVFGHIPGHLPKCAEAAVDALGTMPTHRYGEVLRQDGVGVDEYLVVLLRHELVLLFRTVIVAKEAGPFANALLVDGSACRNNAGRVPLGHLHKVLIELLVFYVNHVFLLIQQEKCYL